MAEHEQATICPWCDTEIVWDDEIGPEKTCPHCDNDLGGYRTLTVGDEEEEVGGEEEWEDDGAGTPWSGAMDLAAEQSVQQVLEHQDEVPECPACRGYMLYAGERTIADRFEPAVPKGLGHALLGKAVQLSVYVCPACFETSTKLSPQTREQFIEALRKK